MQSTIVKVTCISKKEGFQYGNIGFNPEWDIELQVPYNQDSVFYKQIGGTNFTLKTISVGAAEMFVVGGIYSVVISPRA